MKWIVAIGLLVLLAGWVIYQIAAGDLVRPLVPILGIGAGFEGDLALPKAEIDAALTAARDNVLSAADHGYDFRIGSRVAAWLAFLATAAITLVAGWYGQSPILSGGSAGSLPGYFRESGLALSFWSRCRPNSLTARTQRAFARDSNRPLVLDLMGQPAGHRPGYMVPADQYRDYEPPVHEQHRDADVASIGHDIVI
jgi:hypothetical protein